MSSHQDKGSSRWLLNHHWQHLRLPFWHHPLNSATDRAWQTSLYESNATAVIWFIDRYDHDSTIIVNFVASLRPCLIPVMPLDDTWDDIIVALWKYYSHSGRGMDKVGCYLCVGDLQARGYRHMRWYHDVVNLNLLGFIPHSGPYIFWLKLDCNVTLRIWLMMN